MESEPAVLVPIRSFRSGKTRLATVLDPEARRALVEAMAAAALAAVDGLDVRVLTPDAEVAAWARKLGARPVPDANATLNGVLEAARRDAIAEGARSVVVLFADLPSVTRHDVDDLLDLDTPVVIAPDRAGQGTNALHLAAHSPVVYRFGAGSFTAHMAQWPEARVVRRPGLAEDVDDPADLGPHS